jgi:hypothetical protein
MVWVNVLKTSPSHQSLRELFLVFTSYYELLTHTSIYFYFKFILFILLIYFWWYWGLQGFAFAKGVLYHLNYTSSLFCFSYFSYRV